MKIAFIRNPKFAIPAILVLALALRVWGIGFGLPYLYHADEPIVVNHALAYGTGDLNPHFFKIPPLVSYLLFIVYGIFFVLGKLLGFFSSVADFEKLFYTDPSSFYGIARLLFGALLGTLSVYLLYRLVQKYFSQAHALAAALVFAVCFLHVRDSHYIYVDIPLVFVMILGFFPILAILKDSRPKHHILAGILTGLATAVKYNGIALLAPYLAAALFGRKRTARPFILAGASAFLTYSILNPFTWLDFRHFLAEVSLQAKSQSGVALLHHLRYSLWEGVEPFVLAFGMMGILESFRRRNRQGQILSIFILVYYAILVISGQPYDRYVLPLVPWLIVLATHFIFDLAGRYKKGRPLLPALMVLMVLPNLAKSIRFDQIMTAKDVRTQAKEWIEQNLPEGSTIALDRDFYSPRLSFSKAQLEDKKREVESNAAPFSALQTQRLDFLLQDKTKKSPGYHLFFLSENSENPSAFLFAKPLVPYDLKALKEKGIRYVVLPITEGKEEPLFRSSLAEEGKLLIEFSPYRRKEIRGPFDPFALTGGPFLWRELLERNRNGQILQIYELK